MSFDIELLGERQTTLELAMRGSRPVVRTSMRTAAAARPEPLPARVTDDDLAAHAAFVETLGEKAIWKRLESSTR
ncbi:MAG: hypothetical protein AB7F78_22500 [Hyphomicrobiaceae bacterium]